MGSHERKTDTASSVITPNKMASLLHSGCYYTVTDSSLVLCDQHPNAPHLEAHCSFFQGPYEGFSSMTSGIGYQGLPHAFSSFLPSPCFSCAPLQARGQSSWISYWQGDLGSATVHWHHETFIYS